jgi:hypothetical protein
MVGSGVGFDLGSCSLASLTPAAAGASGNLPVLITSSTWAGVSMPDNAAGIERDKRQHSAMRQSHAMLCYAMLCWNCTTVCHTQDMLRYAVLCCAMLELQRNASHPTASCAVLCCAMLEFQLQTCAVLNIPKQSLQAIPHNAPGYWL